MPLSELQHKPKSKVVTPGYINVYSNLNSKELYQISLKTRYHAEHPLWDETMVYLTKLFREHLKDNCEVLDAGCGNGNYIIDECRDKITWAVGIDASQDSMAKNICLDETHVGDLSSLPFSENSFDAVLSLWVLEHLEKPEKVFSEIYRVLRPGGYFMFATPNKNYLPLVITKFIGNTGINNFINKKMYGREEADIFKTYYKANTLKNIWSMSDSFEINELRYNFDPSYTSFNNFTYLVTKFINKITSVLGINFWQPHIIGILWKK